MTGTNHPPVKIIDVKGQSWAQIVGTARALAHLPHGVVVLTHPNGVGLTCDSTGLFKADVTVIPQKEDEPPVQESPEGTYFRLEDLKQAFRDAGMTEDYWVPKIAKHLVRYNRPSGNYYTIEELKRAGKDTEYLWDCAGDSGRLDRIAAQAAKNRISDAFRKDLP
jgi:hypothetical protein